MKPKTQLCPFCGKIMSSDYEKYYGWVYTCLNEQCPSKDIESLKEKKMKPTKKELNSIKKDMRWL